MKMKFKFKQIALTGFTFLVTLSILLPVKAHTQDQPGPIANLPTVNDYSKEVHPKMESVLYRLMEIYFNQGMEEAKAFAKKRAIDMEGDLVRVVLEAQPGSTNEGEVRIASSFVKYQVENSGGKIETSYRQLVQSLVPLDSLQHLADSQSVRYLRLPIKFHPFVTSEGVAKTGADKWHPVIPYHRSQGAKVCILDDGFQGYNSLLGTELPSSVTVRSFRANGNIYAGSAHGTGCAEIIHDMAPDAQLWLVNFETGVDLQNAVDWIITQGVDVISFSMGSYLGGPGDGTGPLCNIVKRASDNGIVWVNSAGNAAEEHWAGTFSDPDGNGWHNFSGTTEILLFYVYKGNPVYAYLKWNDWGTWNGTNYSGSDQDYDLKLYYLNGSNLVWAGQSINLQNGSQWPVEFVNGLTSPTSKYWVIAINKFNATKNVKFDVFVSGSIYPTTARVPAGSLTIPADSPHSVTVGAVDWSNDSYHSYSSQGPTLDGRIKPDLCAPSGVSCVSYGNQGFFGTSAAAPHVAGAFGLLKGQIPYSLGQIKAILEARSIDLGSPGKDNLFGYGRLKLD